jgi:hypothetical protein
MSFTRAWLVLGAGSLAVASTAGAVVPTAAQATAGSAIPQRTVPLPAGQLFGVAATSTDNAWAVGQATSSGKTIILRWNGTAWARVPSPTPSGGGALYAVTATSASNAWAVGGSDTRRA